MPRLQNTMQMRTACQARPAAANGVWRAAPGRLHGHGVAVVTALRRQRPVQRAAARWPWAAAAAGDGGSSSDLSSVPPTPASSADGSATPAAAAAAGAAAGSQDGVVASAVEAAQDAPPLQSLQLWHGMVVQCGTLLARNLWPLVVAAAVTDMAVFFLHRLSHFGTNRAAVALLGLPAQAFGNPWYLSVDPSIATFHTGTPGQ